MITLIPIPRKMEEIGGFFEVTKDTKFSSEIDIEVKGLAKSDDGNFKILLDESLGKEAYKLSVTPKDVTVYASGYSGALYALQTLRQLGKFDLGKTKIPCVNIEDSPQYKWRGIGLDESRHFFGKEEVKRMLRMMSLHKLNVFHWHLTDDQGWRIEIKKYPLLTEIGSVRKCSQVNGWHSAEVLNEKHGGFYTQEDIKEMVQYASKLGIMIVPEIDMPAHFAAALAAYPKLACREIETEVPGYFGGKIPESQGNKDWNRTACIGKKETFDFIYEVLDEVCELFPAPYIHIGGDEAPRNEWKKCPNCQKVIKDNGLKSEDELQGYFNNKINEYITKKGKRLIGWNEILKSKNLDNSVIGQYWTPKRDKNAEKYVNNGGELILSKHQSFYFDMPYALRSLKSTYNFVPVSKGIKWASRSRILGVEGEVWSEWIDGREKLDCYLYPRMEALSEVAWSPDYKKDWHYFMLRLNDFKPCLEKLGIGYAADKVSCPKGLAKKAKINKKFTCGDTHLEVKLNQKYKSKGEK